ncbi:MAG: cyanophycin synthetase family protein [Akkermansiaceae bacterium]
MKSRDIRFLKILSIRGPNIWTYKPVLEAWVDIGEFEDYPSNTLPGFVDRLCEWLPSLSEHRCSYGEAGGFVRRLQEGTWIGHILEHVTLELQNIAGMPGGFGRARETSVRGVYKVVVQTWHEEMTRDCFDAARSLLLAAVENTPFDVALTHARLREMALKYLLGSNTACIIDAAIAKDRGIPAIRLSDDNLMQLGYGSLQRRIWAAQTDRASAIAQGIARDSELRDKLLGYCGLPMLDPDDVTEEAESRNHYRLLVVGGELVAAARIEAKDESVAVDITDEVHPATATAACLATRVVGLDIAGVDILADDISCQLDKQNGVITAVVETPNLMVHQQRQVGRRIVDHLFPNAQTGRIPVVGITGDGGVTETAHWVTEFLRLSGKFTGLACGDGLYFDNRKVESGDCGNWNYGTKILMNRSVDAAVIENSAEVILGQGLAYDRCQIGVVTGVDSEKQYSDYDIATPEQVFKVFRSQVDVVLPSGVAVLNAADTMVAEMAALCDGEVIFFAEQADIPVMLEHRAKGGRLVYIRGGDLILANAKEEVVLISLASIPFLNNDQSPERLDIVLASVATAWALGIAINVMRTGAETFSMN